MKKRLAYSYIRFSKMVQRLGDSLRRQVENTKRFCEQHNLTLVEEMKDLGVSAFKGKNLEDDAKLGEFLSRVKAGKIPQDSVLIVESFDRISRDKVTRCQRILLEIIENGIGIAPLSFGGKIITEETAAKEPTLLIMAIVEQMRGNNESQVKSERVLASLKNKSDKITNGEKIYFGGLMPSYIRGVERGEWIVDDRKVGLVKRIFSDYLVGKAMTKIAHELNEDEKSGKIPSGGMKLRHNHHRGHWSQATVKCILGNRSVTGDWRLKGKEYPNYLPVIVSKDDFEKVQLRMKQNKNNRGGSPNGLIRNLFKGLTKCAHCGGTIGVITSKQNGKDYPYYLCTSARFHRCECRSALKAEYLEEQFFFNILRESPVSIVGKENTEYQTKLAQLKNGLNHCDKVAADISELIGSFPISEIKTRLASNESERERIKKEITELNGLMITSKAVPGALDDLKAIFNRAVDKRDNKDQVIQAIGRVVTTLEDQTMRAKLVNILPNIVSKIVIDLKKRTYKAELVSGETLEDEIIAK